MAACALYAMQENDLGEQLKAFLERTGLSMTDIAERVDRLGVEPKGKTVQKARVWNYVRGASNMPGWFSEALDGLYPNWRDGETVNSTSRQMTTNNPLYSEDGAARLAPLLPPIGSDLMSEALQSIRNDSWSGRFLPVPRFLDPKHPLQPVEDNVYAPAFRTGDAVQLRLDVYPLLGRLYAVSLKTGGTAYAACVDVAGRSLWQLYDGTTLPLEDCQVEAAIVAVLPQYTPGAEVGTINKDGLLTGSQVPWPK